MDFPPQKKFLLEKAHFWYHFDGFWYLSLFIRYLASFAQRWTFWPVQDCTSESQPEPPVTQAKPGERSRMAQFDGLECLNSCFQNVKTRTLPRYGCQMDPNGLYECNTYCMCIFFSKTKSRAYLIGWIFYFCFFLDSLRRLMVQLQLITTSQGTSRCGWLWYTYLQWGHRRSFFFVPPSTTICCEALSSWPSTLP